jgi:ubiquitin C-terminal hydrolase
MNDLGIKNPFDIRIFFRNLEVTTNEDLFGTAASTSLHVKVHFSFPESKLRGLFQTADIRQLTDLSFDHSPLTLESCLERFSRKEELDQENMWYCPSCKEHKRASKKMVISRLPRVLIVHLKRFKRVAPDRPQFRKFADLITFPLEGLDMSPYCNDPGAPATYDLFAVSSHYGSVSNGHYVAFTKNLRTKQWNCYDDRMVRPVEEGEVANKYAYLLFYSLRTN